MLNEALRHRGDGPQLFTHPSSRWCCRQHLNLWLDSFRDYFPRKAHLAGQVLASLCHSNSLDLLLDGLPDKCDDQIGWRDPLFAERRMEWFCEDRLLLIQQYRIKPDAADLFLTHCPVGCSRCYCTADEGFPFDESFCYYADDERPSKFVREIIMQQHQQALGCRYARMHEAGRLSGDYLPPRMYAALFKELGWEFRHDLDDDLEIKREIPLTRLGWLLDPELGEIECFNIPAHFHPLVLRDELQATVLQELSTTRDLFNTPVLVLFNRPVQLQRQGVDFTSIGCFATGQEFKSCYVPPERKSLADVFVESTCFTPTASRELADHGGAMFSTYWSLLLAATDSFTPQPVRYLRRPDGWALPLT